VPPGTSPTVADPSAPVPPPPRAVTPHVRRQSLSDPIVRAWLIAAAILILLSIYELGSQLAGWWADESLIGKNTVVDAVVRQAAETDIKGRPKPVDSVCELDFTFNGKAYEVSGTLAGREEFIVVGQTVKLHIDPDNPTRWTAYMQTPPLGLRLVTFGVEFPVALLVLAVALWQRSRVLKIWHSGTAQRCIVVDTRQTALAPRSIAVRCTPEAQRDRRVVTVVLPPRLGKPNAGDGIWLIFPPGKFKSPLPAAAYE
jgi:hypothetical protein